MGVLDSEVALILVFPLVELDHNIFAHIIHQVFIKTVVRVSIACLLVRFDVLLEFVSNKDQFSLRYLTLSIACCQSKRPYL